MRGIKPPTESLLTVKAEGSTCRDPCCRKGSTESEVVSYEKRPDGNFERQSGVKHRVRYWVYAKYTVLLAQGSRASIRYQRVVHAVKAALKFV